MRNAPDELGGGGGGGGGGALQHNATPVFVAWQCVEKELFAISESSSFTTLVFWTGWNRSIWDQKSQMSVILTETQPKLL